jgi:hypothetical protein
MTHPQRFSRSPISLRAVHEPPYQESKCASIGLRRLEGALRSFWDASYACEIAKTKPLRDIVEQCPERFAKDLERSALSGEIAKTNPLLAIMVQSLKVFRTLSDSEVLNRSGRNKPTASIASGGPERRANPEGHEFEMRNRKNKPTAVAYVTSVFTKRSQISEEIGGSSYESFR